MDLQIYELVSSDICKLIYGYLIESDLFPLAVEFLDTSPYMTEFSKVRRQNKMFISTVNGFTLEQWLEKAALIFSVEKYVEQKCAQFKIDKAIMKDKNLLEQLDMLLKHVQQLTSHTKPKVTPTAVQRKATSTNNANVKPCVQENHDENVLKKLTEKDKKILVDVFENKDTVSELLAQKIAEELNKKTLQGSSHDINDIVQEVAKNTASDDIFDDLCVEMYEEGFLSSFVLSPNKSRTPRKPVSPQKTPSKSRLHSSPLQTEGPPEQPMDTDDVTSPLSHSTIVPDSSPVSQYSNILEPVHQPDRLVNPPTNSTMVENLPSEGSPKTYHVMRPMSVASDVSSVASASSLESVLTNSVYAGAGTGYKYASGPVSQSQPMGQFVVPAHQNGMGSPGAKNLGQPIVGTSLIFLPMVSQANMILTPIKSHQAIAPLTLTTPSPYQSIAPCLSSNTPMMSHSKRYTKIKPKPPQNAKPAQKTNNPYKIIVQVPNPVPNQNVSAVQEVQPGNNLVMVDQTKIGSITNCATNEHQTNMTNKTNANNFTEYSPYKLDNFISFNNSTSSQNQAQSKDVMGNNTSDPCTSNTIDTSAHSLNTPSSTLCTSNIGGHETTSFQTLVEDVGIPNDKSDTSSGKDATDAVNSNNSVVPQETLLQMRNDGQELDDNGRGIESNGDDVSSGKMNEKDVQHEPTPNNLCQIDLNSIEHNATGQTEINNVQQKEHGTSSNEMEQNHLPQLQNSNELGNSSHNLNNPPGNQSYVSIEKVAESHQEPTANSLLDDSVKFIINEEPLDTNVVYETTQVLNLSNEVNLDAVIVIPPSDETIVEQRNAENEDGAESEHIDVEVLSEGNTDHVLEREDTTEPCEETITNQVSGEEQNTSGASDEVDVTCKDTELNTSSNRNMKDFYLVKEPSNIFVVVNDNPVPSKKNKNVLKPISKNSLEIPKYKHGTKKPKVLEKCEKSSPEVPKTKNKVSKQSPCILKETLYSRIISDKETSSATKQNNSSLDFLNSTCKVTPAVKVLSTPKRKSSSTPRRSYVRALKFETPLKPALKRKCNTSPKDCQIQLPFERIEKPKNVSRNLCEDIEMKKDVKKDQPWDLGLRSLVGVPDNKISPNEIQKRRKRDVKKRRSQVRSEKSKKSKVAPLNTIDEELNNSHDNAKCSLDLKGTRFQKENGKKNKNATKTTSLEGVIPVECDPKSNEGSVLSLNIEDTPLKIADFQDDIHENLKTPSKDTLFPSKSLSFTPIDNIIRNNLGESESLLKIIEDINMFKETPIKEALANLSDKSKTPSPCKSTQEVLSNTKEKEHEKDKARKEISPTPKKTSKNRSTKKGQNKGATNSVSKCKRNSQTNGDDVNSIKSCDRSFESGSTKRKNTGSNKRNQKLTENTSQPLRRSLRSNSSISKEKCSDVIDKGNTAQNEKVDTKNNKKKKCLKKDNENQNGLDEKEDTSEGKNTKASSEVNGDVNVQSVTSNQSIPQTLQESNSLHEDINGPNKNNQLDKNTSCHETDTEKDDIESEEHNHLAQVNLDKISTFLDDCMSENEKLKQLNQNAVNESNKKGNTRKRHNTENLEDQDEINLKKRRESSVENILEENQFKLSNTRWENKQFTTEIKDLEKVQNYENLKPSTTSPTKINTTLKNTMEHSNSIQSAGEKTHELSPEINKTNVIETQDTMLEGEQMSNNIVPNIENPESGLNLSTSSSDKENSSAIDIIMNSHNENNLSSSSHNVTPMIETVNNSPDKSKNSLHDSKDISSNCILNLSENSPENHSTNNEKPSIVDKTIVNEIPSDDDVEDNKLFLSISHQDNRSKSTPLSNNVNLSDQSDSTKNLSCTIEVFIGEIKLDLSTFSHNVLNLEPRTN